MPIYSLEGTPGSGKTLYCVQKINPRISQNQGRAGKFRSPAIYTNIEGLKARNYMQSCGHTIREYSRLFPCARATCGRERAHVRR